MIQIQVSIRIYRELISSKDTWIFQALCDNSLMIVQGISNNQKTAEARVYRACAEYFQDLQELADPTL